MKCEYRAPEGVTDAILRAVRHIRYTALFSLYSLCPSLSYAISILITAPRKQLGTFVVI